MKYRHTGRILAVSSLLVGSSMMLGASSAMESNAGKIVMEGDGARRKALDAMQGKAAPKLSGTEWINTDISGLGDLEGKVVMLDFWGVWCGPCVRSVPMLKELYAKYADQGFVLVGVHTTNQGEKAASFVAEQGIEYPIVVDKDGKTVEKYKVDSFPDVYLIDHKGVLRYADVANSSHGNIEAAIEELLAERNGDES